MLRLLSFVFSVSPTQPITVANHMGRAVQQFALRKIFEPYSSSLSASLHDSNGIKPYTVSSLFHSNSARPLQQRITASDSAWFRITTVGEEVSNALHAWSNAMPAVIEIDQQYWQVHGVAKSSVEHPWAAETNLGNLIQSHHAAPPPRFLTLEFVSPTSFHSESLHVPLPIPSLVFQSLIDRWISLTPFALNDYLLFFAKQFIEVAGVSIDTRSVMLKNDPIVGFEGKVKYAIKRTNEGLTRLEPAIADELSRVHDDLVRSLALLTDFGFFCGVGTKTAAGLGMVTPL